MAGKCKDNFIGKKFHMLTVVERVRQEDGTTGWVCLCECGNKKILASSYIRREVHKSCGCYRKVAPKLATYANKGKTKDLTGKKFNRLTCISVSHQADDRKYHWNCLCDCGKTSVVSAQALISGGTKSCGCLVIDAPSKVKHGHVRRDESGKKRPTKEFKCWSQMKRRVLNAHPGYEDVLIYPDWINDFRSFLNHIGPAPSDKHSIDRIDPSGHYFPGNVRWGSVIDQARNKRGTIMVEHEGVTMPLAKACELCGFSYEFSRELHHRGLSFQQIKEKRAAHKERLKKRHEKLTAMREQFKH